MKKYSIPIIITLTLLTGFLLVKFTNLNQIFPTKIIAPTTISPDILSITQPVYNLIGEVQSVEQNNVTIKKMDSTHSNTQSTLTYKVKVNSETYFTKNDIVSANIPASPSANLTVNNLKKGQLISVSSKKDLRTLLIREFEATRIDILFQTLSGTLLTKRGDILTIKGLDNKEYSVLTNTTTKVSNPLVGNTNLANLKENTQLIVNHDPSENNGSNIKALSIQIIPVTLPNTAIQIASPSAR